MPEVEIIRKAIFTVDKVESDDYGNMTVIDKEGKPHKVNAKHKDLHPVFVSGMAVEVGYGEYMKREFIHTARQVKDALLATTTGKGQPESPKTTNTTSPQERGMFWKELGECLRRDGFFSPNIQQTLKVFYCNEMYQVLGIKVEDLKK